jgi:hypothetical protein
MITPWPGMKKKLPFGFLLISGLVFLALSLLMLYLHYQFS